MSGYIKRDRGGLLKSDKSLPEKLEEEFDLMIREMNQSISEKDKQLKKLESEILKLKQNNVAGGDIDSPLASVEYNDSLYYGMMPKNIIKTITYANTSLLFAELTDGDIIEGITIITRKPDTGISEFKLNDSMQDLFTLEDVDVSIISANNPVKSMWVDYSILPIMTLVATTVATNLFTKTFHLLKNGDNVRLLNIENTTGIASGTDYYVIDATDNTFKLSATKGGSVITLGGADGTCSVEKQLLFNIPLTLTLTGGTKYEAKIVIKYLRLLSMQQTFALL